LILVFCPAAVASAVFVFGAEDHRDLNAPADERELDVGVVNPIVIRREAPAVA